MKCVISQTFTDTLSRKITMTKVFFDKLEKRFIPLRYKGKRNIKVYIFEIFYLASKLKALKFKLFEDLPVHLTLIYLPTQSNPFQVSCIIKETNGLLMGLSFGLSSSCTSVI